MNTVLVPADSLSRVKHFFCHSGLSPKTELSND
jgi:hypothetical protein